MQRLWFAGSILALFLSTLAAEEASGQEAGNTGTGGSWYAGGGLTMGIYESQCPAGCDYEDYTSGILLTGGYTVNRYVALEARVVQTFWGAGENGGERIRAFGLFVKPLYPVSEAFSLYALLGYGSSWTTTGGNGNLPELDESSFSWGVGFEHDLSHYDDSLANWRFFFDYQSILDDQAVLQNDRELSVTIKAFNIGVGYNF